MVVATTAATTRQVKNTHPAGARALAVLESPNRRGWGLIVAFWRGSGVSAWSGLRVDELPCRRVRRSSATVRLDRFAQKAGSLCVLCHPHPRRDDHCLFGCGPGEVRRPDGERIGRMSVFQRATDTLSLTLPEKAVRRQELIDPGILPMVPMRGSDQPKTQTKPRFSVQNIVSTTNVI